MKTAFFTEYPKRAEELTRPRPVEEAAPYEIAGTVSLGKLDYDNFASDMLVSREFLELGASGCGVGGDGTLHCLLVQCAGRPGLLIVPDPDGAVRFAAVLREP